MTIWKRHTAEPVSYDCLIGTHTVSICLPHPVAVSVFIICSGLCACTEMNVCAVCLD